MFLQALNETVVNHIFKKRRARALVGLSISTCYWIALQKEGTYHEES